MHDGNLLGVRLFYQRAELFLCPGEHPFAGGRQRRKGGIHSPEPQARFVGCWDGSKGFLPPGSAQRPGERCFQALFEESGELVGGEPDLSSESPSEPFSDGALKAFLTRVNVGSSPRGTGPGAQPSRQLQREGRHPLRQGKQHAEHPARGVAFAASRAGPLGLGKGVRHRDQRPPGDGRRVRRTASMVFHSVSRSCWAAALSWVALLLLRPTR